MSTWLRWARPVWRYAPAALALVLLPLQVAIPWAVPHFVTQDGPSHLYGAAILKDVVLHHRTSPYSRLYTVQRKVVPNWTASMLLAASESLVGTAQAEKLLIAIAILAGFAGWCYCAGAISPVANAMLQVWFLLMGFHNFYLGMALLPWVLGYYRWRAGRMDWRQTAVLAAAMTVLLLTHPVPAVIAMFALPLMAFATCGLRELVKIAVSAAPAALLLAIYAGGPRTLAAGGSGAAAAWHEFPMHVFLTGAGAFGAQRYTWMFVLCFSIAAALLLKKREWRSPLGGLAAAAVLCFLLYLFLPDSGLGGSLVKIRFSWAIFVLGGILAWSAARLRHLRTPAAVLVAVLVAANLQATTPSARALSDAASDYLAAVRAIPPHARFVRLHYATPDAPARFGYEGLGVDPLFHLDGMVAAERAGIDLSDYEPICKVFPVVYKNSVAPVFQSNFWAMEGPGEYMVGVLKWLDENFPVRIDYYIVVGQPAAAQSADMGMGPMLAYLDSNMCLVGSSPSGMTRVYGRRADTAGCSRK